MPLPSDTLLHLFASAQDHYGITKGELLSPARPRNLSHIRFAIIHLLSEAHPHLTDEQIAQHFYRDRSAISHARKATRDLIAIADPFFTKVLAALAQS